MKTNIVINIGLESTQGNPVELHHAIHEIERVGITCLASGVVQGEWEGKAEQTLVIEGLCFESLELNARIYSASRALSQHCIAVYRNGKGELIGENSNGWKFDPELFHFHCRETVDEKIASLHSELLAKAYPPQLSECQAMQRLHAERARQAGIHPQRPEVIIP